MFWDDKKDDKDAQRFKNLMFVHFWGTNEDRDELFSSPWFWGILWVICLILIALGSSK